MSDIIDLDFTGVGRGPILLDEGDYILTISDVQVKPPKNETTAKGSKAYPSVWVTYEVEGARIMDFFSLHPNSMWVLRNWLESVTGQEIEGPLQLNPADLIGAVVQATLTIEPRNDKPDIMTNKITSYGFVG